MIWLIKFKTDRQTNKKFTDRETRSRNLKTNEKNVQRETSYKWKESQKDT